MQIKSSAAATYLKNQGIPQVTTGVILGTGLHQLSTHLQVIKKIPYADIPGFSTSTVETHPGNLIFGTLGDKSVLVMQGRFHAYEGYTYAQITFPIQVMKLMGVDTLFVSNAAGAVNTRFRKGNLMRITGHINLQGLSAGPSMQNLSHRTLYDIELGALFSKIATELNVTCYEGIYAAVNGPQLETRAEYRYLQRIGADVVGMSTVPEVTEANRQQMRCLAISVITDECDPDNLQPVTLAEIIKIANGADETLTTLLLQTIRDAK